MADILIDEDKAQRIIARHMRENGMLPEKANQTATRICSNLAAAMTTPSKPLLQGWRIINSQPPHNDDKYRSDVRKHIASDADGHFARELWQVVWDHGIDLPADIAPPRNW